MKKWLMLAVLGGAVAAAAGLSSRVAAQPEGELSEAEFNARVDARLLEVMRTRVLSERSATSGR